jgi:acyl-CoA thioesterase-1
MTNNQQASKVIQYLALGDSYTIGEGVKAAQSFPFLLAKNINATLVNPTVLAQTGWTTTELISAITKAQLSPCFDLVSLLIGVNNQYRGLDLEVFKTEFLALVHQAIFLAKGDKNNVFIISIPDYGYTPFGVAQQIQISKDIALYNDYCKSIADALGIKYFYITTISNLGLAEATLLTSDGLHPSEKLYQLWVDMMKTDIAQKIS